MNMRRSIITGAWLGFLCITLTKAGPLPRSRIEARAFREAEDAVEIGKSEGKLFQESKAQTEVPHSGQNPGVESIPRNTGPTQTSGDQEVTNLDRDDKSKKTSETPEQNKSILARIGRLFEDLKKTLISKWPRNPEKVKPVVQEGSKPAVLEKSSSAIPLASVGPIRRWYLTSKSSGARFLRLIRRYFTWNKPKPVTTPKKSPETAEAVKVPPVAEGSTVKKDQTVNEESPIKLASGQVVQVEDPQKIKPGSKVKITRVTPVTEEMLTEALHDNAKVDHTSTPHQSNPTVVVSA